MSRYHGRDIPWSDYHGVPAGWEVEKVLALHAQMHGRYPIDPLADPAAVATHRAAPTRDGWLGYRAMLFRIADGVAAKDAACIELAVQFILRHHIGSYSGYVRSLMARRLRHAERLGTQDERLHAHFTAMVVREERCQEFAGYLKLWRVLLDDERCASLSRALDAPGVAAGQRAWLTAALGGRWGAMLARGEGPSA